MTKNIYLKHVYIVGSVSVLPEPKSLQLSPIRHPVGTDFHRLFHGAESVDQRFQGIPKWSM